MRHLWQVLQPKMFDKSLMSAQTQTDQLGTVSGDEIS